MKIERDRVMGGREMGEREKERERGERKRSLSGCCRGKQNTAYVVLVLRNVVAV